ncbi:MAG TPA: PilN domain-containing protein [Rudaea sp.]|nr:PilN domain-containing protein [Rudaea sp.]
MNLSEQIDLQLARLRTRYARTPLPRFFAWWGGELASMLPANWRALLAERSDAVLLETQDRELVIWRQSGINCTQLGRISLDEPPEAQKAAFAQVRSRLDDPNLREFYCVSAQHSLRRTINLPAAAEDNLRRVLTFEMDRQTPFKADQVYFDYRLATRTRADRNLHVELTVVTRTQLDAELAAIAACNARLDGVDCWTHGSGSQRAGLNLLPVEQRFKRKNLPLRLNLALAAAALVLLVTAMLLWLANQESALGAMQTQVESAQKEAAQVAKLRKTLQDSVDSANFLGRKKLETPVMVELLNDLTKRLPDDTYLERLNVDEKNKIELQGLSDDASKLIGLLQQSDLLTNPTVQGTIQPDPRTKKDRFNISLEFRPPADAKAANVSAKAPGQASAQHKPVPDGAMPKPAGERHAPAN